MGFCRFFRVRFYHLVGLLTLKANDALAHFGRVDLLFNNAIYQGQGNQERILDVSREQLLAIYQGNVFTPLALIKTLLPGMVERGDGSIINYCELSVLDGSGKMAAELCLNAT